MAGTHALIKGILSGEVVHSSSNLDLANVMTKQDAAQRACELRTPFSFIGIYYLLLSCETTACIFTIWGININ